MYTNAGIKVCREGQVRFTCAKYGWDKPSIDNAVYHGNHAVGTITETYGENTGLVTTQYSFSNEFLDLNIRAKHLLHSSLIPFGEFAVINSVYTSRQRMRLFGIRTSKKRVSPNYIGLWAPYEHVVLEQGIFSVQAAIINREPRIRDDVCGTPIVRHGMTLTDQSALERGEVLGFIHYTDVVGCSNDGRLYSYGQVVDQLIEAGWEVCSE